MTAQLDAFARALDRAEPAEARVFSEPQEAELVRLVTAFLVSRANARPDATFTADEAGDYLDSIGLPRAGKAAMNLRKRIVSSAINHGKREGRWHHRGYAISTRHGGPRTVWQVGA